MTIEVSRPASFLSKEEAIRATGVRGIISDIKGRGLLTLFDVS